MKSTVGEREIVLLQPHLKFGGAENQTVLIANDLVEKGHRCTVVLHSREGGLLPALDTRVRVIDLGFSSHLRIPLATLRARRVLRQLPPSLILVRLWSSIMLVGLIHRSLSKHRVVYFEDLDPRDHREFIKFGRLKQAIIGAIFRRHEDALVANTNHVARAMRSVYRLPAEPHIIECGVNPRRIEQLAKAGVKLPEARDDALRLITVGSLIDRKGIRELWSAVASLDRRVQWVVVGEGPLSEWLLSVSAPHVDVVLVGGTDNPYPYMASADVLIHGAKSESFGIVLLEALALGKGVVAHASEGPVEIASNLPDAPIQIVDVADHAAFASAVEIAATTPPLSSALGPYTIDNTVANWVAVASSPA